MIRKFLTIQAPVNKLGIQTAVCQSNGERTIELIFPYGQYGVVPTGSTGIAFNIMAQEENKSGFAYNPSIIPTVVLGQVEGEYIVGNFLKGTYIYFNDDNEIIIQTDKKVTVNSENTTVNATGKVTVISPDVEVTASNSAKVTSPNIDFNGGEFTMSSGSATFTIPVNFTGGISSNGVSIDENHGHAPGTMQAGGDPVTGNSGAVS